MHADIVSLLVCPDCKSIRLKLVPFESSRDGDIKEGYVACNACATWYPIQKWALEFLPKHLAYWDDRYTFYSRHRRRLSSPPQKKKPLRATPQHEQQHYFDWYAENDTQKYSAYADTPFWKAMDSIIFGAWRKKIPDGARLVDVGCAQGRSAFQFSNLPITIVGFDISKKMIDEAVKQYKRRRYRAKCSFLVADATNFPLRDRAFDVVLLYGVLHHVARPAHVCREIVRVLGSRGMYFGLENHTSLVRKIFDIMQRVAPLWYEKAGSIPIMSEADIRRWFRGLPINIETRIRAFIPPHAVNLFPYAVSRKLLHITDTNFGSQPLVRRLGGLIEIVGTRHATGPVYPS